MKYRINTKGLQMKKLSYLLEDDSMCGINKKKYSPYIDLMTKALLTFLTNKIKD